MVKSYFLTYGAKNEDVDTLGQRIAQVLGMTIEIRDSSYVGLHINCIGPQADSISIVPNRKVGENYQLLKEYPVLVEVANIKGKNVDKEARTLHVKQQLVTIPELVLLKDLILEK